MIKYPVKMRFEMIKYLVVMRYVMIKYLVALGPPPSSGSVQCSSSLLHWPGRQLTASPMID